MERSGSLAEIARSDSDDINAGDLSDHQMDEEERKRIKRVSRKKTNRMSVHIASFLRIIVIIKPSEQCLRLTVDSAKSIEYLAGLIEADYTFTESEKLLSDSSLHTDLDDQQAFEPLAVGVITDVDGEPYNFETIISDVISMGETIHAINSYGVDNSPRQAPLTMAPLKSDNDNKNRGSMNELQSDFDLLKPSTEAGWVGTRMEMISDNQFQSLFRNQVGLQLLAGFCVKTRCIENLLFWIDVEILRTAPTELQMLCTKYIYYFYVNKKAPLRINLTKEIVEDISIASTSPTLSNFANVYDEAQEHIYWILKNQTLPPFKQSEGFTEFLNFRKRNRQAYYSSKIRNFFMSFKCDLELLLQVCGEAEIQNLTRFNYAQRERYLNRLLNRYFPALQLAEGYFDSAIQSGQGQRIRKGQKEKKLSKFFGADDAQQKGLLMSKVQQQVSAMLTADKYGRIPSSLATFDDTSRPESDNEAATISETLENSDSAVKRRKAGKLEEFFGDKIDSQQLIRQKLVSNDTPSETPMTTSEPLKSAVPPETHQIIPTWNELASEDKKTLAKRVKKLKNVFGEVFDEDATYQQFTKKAFSQTPAPTRKPRTESIENSMLALVPTANQRSRSGSISNSIITFECEQSDNTHDESTSDIHSASSDSSDHSMLENLKNDTRRRRDKLNSLFGERNIPSENITITQPILTVNRHKAKISEQKTQVKEVPLDKDATKKRSVKRVNKIVKLLGELPPSDMMTKNEQRTAAHLQSIASIGMMLSQDQIVLQLVGYLSHQKLPSEKSQLTQLGNPLVKPNKITRDVSVNGDTLSDNRHRTSVVDSLIDEPVTKGVRQKKMNKLQKFFGDQIDPVALIEQNIIDKLEKQIEEDMQDDQPSLFILKEDIQALRKQVRDVTENLRNTMTKQGNQDDGGDDEEENTSTDNEQNKSNEQTISVSGKAAKFHPS